MSQIAQLAEDLTVSLEYNGKLIDKVGKSLVQTKKRLYETELLLNLEPPPDDKAMVQQWSKAVNEVLSRKDHLQFPSLRKMKKEREAQRQREKEELHKKEHHHTHHHTHSHTHHIDTQDNASTGKSAVLKVDKQVENLRAMVLNRKGKFGGSVSGEPIRTVHNYSGANSVYSGSRTLVRKEGNRFGDFAESPLPPWFGPQYYEIAEKESRPATHYQVAFKATGRNNIPEGPLDKQSNSRRRRVIRYIKSTDSVSKSVMPLNSSHTSATNANEEEDVDAEETDSQADEDEVHTGIEDENNFNDLMAKQEASVADSFHTHEFFASKDKSSSASKGPLLAGSWFTLRSGSLSRQRSAKQTVAKRTENSTTDLRTIRLKPIHSQHAYALKVLSTEERRAERWQVPDYTRGALANQSPLLLDGYSIEDTLMEGDQAELNPTNLWSSKIEAEKARKEGKPFNAEIFFMKPQKYEPSPALLPNYNATLQSKVVSPTVSPLNSRPPSQQPNNQIHSGLNELSNDKSAHTFHSGLNELNDLSNDKSVHTLLRKWRENNDIIDARQLKKKNRRDNFLNDHPVLPSIELSLSGLLLDHNPLTDKDDLIKTNPGFSVESFKV